MSQGGEEKPMSRLLCALAFGWIAVGNPAHARPDRWTSPDGVFSVAFPTGWEAFEGTIPGPGERLLAIRSPTMRSHQPAPRELFVRECAIRQEPNPIMRRNQSEINAALEDGKVLDFVVKFAFPSAEHSRSNEIIEGIRILSYDIDINLATSLIGLLARTLQPDTELPEAPPVRLMQRMFIIPADDGAMQYFLVCYASQADESPADIEAMSSFLESLAFNR